MTDRARRPRTFSFIRGSRTPVLPLKCECGPRVYELVDFVRSVVVPVISKSIYQGSRVWLRERERSEQKGSHPEESLMCYAKDSSVFSLLCR